jgi:hypothetical protein
MRDLHEGVFQMMIPLGRRRLSISFIPSPAPDPSRSVAVAAESDSELARLASRQGAVKLRAEQDISRILYAGPPVR